MERARKRAAREPTPSVETLDAIVARLTAERADAQKAIRDLEQALAGLREDMPPASARRPNK